MRSGWELPNRLGPWICLVNGAIAVALVAFLASSIPTLAEGQPLTDHPWLATWMRATAVLAMLLPASTVMLWRACPVQHLPESQWKKGAATPLRDRVRRGAPRGAKLALLGLVVHGIGLLSTIVLAVIAAGALD